MKRFLVLLLSLSIAFLAVGCQKTEENNVSETAESEIQTEAADEETTEASDAISPLTVVATVNGEEIIYDRISGQVAVLESMYNAIASQLSEEELKTKLHEGALGIVNSFITNEILLQKAKEYGIELTAEEIETAEKQWDVRRQSIIDGVKKDYPELEGEDLQKMTDFALDTADLDKTAIVREAKEAMTIAKLKEKVLEEVDTVEQTEIDAEYDILLTEQKELFKDNTAFETEMLSGNPVLWIPEDYRVIRELNVQFEPETLAFFRDLKQYDDEESTTYEDLLKEEFAKLRLEKLKKITEEYAGGKTFAELCKEYDPGNENKLNYINEHSTRFSDEYKNIAMSIKEPGTAGDEYLQREYGFSILYWDSILKAGLTDEAEAKKAIGEKLIKDKQVRYWLDMQEKWKEEADIKIFDEVLKY